MAEDARTWRDLLSGLAQGHYVTFGFDTTRAGTPYELREVVTVAGRLLIGAVHTADPQSTAWYPHGYFAPTGFAAMGAAEGLVHGHDIASALGLDWRPDSKVCAAAKPPSRGPTAAARFVPSPTNVPLPGIVQNSRTVSRL